MNSVDSIWLVLPLRFGLPTIVFLGLANIAAILPTKTLPGMLDPFLERMRTAFTLVLILFSFVGLTVHYWNYIWIFWAICLGIRVSLREISLYPSVRPLPYPQPIPSRLAGDRLHSPIRV